MSIEHVDELIHAKWIITAEPHQEILADHTLVIKQGKILAILPRQKARSRYQANANYDYATHAVLPGFINTHTHVAMNVFRGLADDLALMVWLNDYIWPAEREWVSSDLVYDASLLAMAEMIRCGTTCFNDMYFFPMETAKAVEEVGMQAHLGMTIIDFPTRWAKDSDDYFAKGLEFYQHYQHHPFIKPTLAPQGVYTVSEKELAKVKALADKYQLQVNIHVQESLSDIEGAIKLNQKRPLICLNDVGLISPQLIAIHMTQLETQDFELIANKKPNVVHCPESNMKLASGCCPVQKLLELGLNVALGTDGAASNNDLDMIGEMRSAALLGKLATGNPKALSASEVLTMATLNGAKALGREKEIGSLAVGKSADFIAINLEELETQPLYDPVSQIVYAASRNQVTDVWVRGKQLLKNRELTTLDEKELLKKARNWRKKIKN